MQNDFDYLAGGIDRDGNRIRAVRYDSGCQLQRRFAGRWVRFASSIKQEVIIKKFEEIAEIVLHRDCTAARKQA